MHTHTQSKHTQCLLCVGVDSPKLDLQVALIQTSITGPAERLRTRGCLVASHIKQMRGWFILILFKQWFNSQTSNRHNISKWNNNNNNNDNNQSVWYFHSLRLATSHVGIPRVENIFAAKKLILDMCYSYSQDTAQSSWQASFPSTSSQLILIQTKKEKKYKLALSQKSRCES